MQFENVPADRIPLPLLVTGITGVAGYNAFHYFRERYPGQVIGIRQSDSTRLLGSGIVCCDAEDESNLARLFEVHQFKCVLNCAGNCALRACEVDPSLARRINVEGVKTLLSVLAGTGTRLVHASIDLVFSGSKGEAYDEQDPTDPVTVYGKTMVEAEELLCANATNCCIVRISLPMGISLNGHAGAIDWIQSRFRKGKPATLYFDEVRTPSYTDCLNVLFEELLAHSLTGIFHAGGARRLSLYEIAQVINRVGGYDPNLLLGCPRCMAGPIPPRAGDVTMNSNKLTQALGHPPLDAWPYAEQLVPSDRDWHRDRSHRDFKGSHAYLAQVLYRNPRLAAAPSAPIQFPSHAHRTRRSPSRI